MAAFKRRSSAPRKEVCGCGAVAKMANLELGARSVSICMFFFVSLSVSLSVFLPDCFSVCLSVCVSHLSSLSLCLSRSLSLSLFLSRSLSRSLSRALSLSLSLSFSLSLDNNRKYYIGLVREINNGLVAFKTVRASTIENKKIKLDKGTSNYYSE